MKGESGASPRPLGIIANPMSGRDVRRYAARGSHVTPESKRDQVARAVIGAVAAGVEHVFVLREPFAISRRAVENLRIDAKIETLDLGARLDAGDSARAARAMREAGCGALVVLGGDGTNRAVARAWRDAPLLPLSTGTNNVFPEMIEATVAGAAAGLVASGRIELAEVSRAAKLICVEIESEPDDLALVDAVLLKGDHVGNYMPFEPERMRRMVLARAEPGAVGSASIGGLLLPCGAEDDFAVTAGCVPHAEGGRPLLVPIAPGLYRKVHVAEAARLALGVAVAFTGPGVLAFDGDRERELAPDQRAQVRVVREGPRVIDAACALRVAAERELFVGRPPWHDAYDGAWRASCC